MEVIMGILRRCWWSIAFGVLAGLASACTPAGRDSGSPGGGATRLALESFGGFAYVHSPQDSRLEIAYLRDSNSPGCSVDQLGVELMVISGNIIEPANPPANRIFDMEGAVVTFPDLEASAGTLVATRGQRPNGPPGNPNNPADWHDLKWVAGISPDYPNSSLNPNWRDTVDGRVVLTRGVIRGANPSDVVVKDAVFEFRRPSGTGTFRQAMTDTTMFEAQVPSDRIVMNLSGAKSGITRIVVTPVASGQPVQLKLMGRHVHGTPGALPLDAPISHFCAFYDLLQPRPAAADQLIPYFSGNPQVGAANRLGQPSPGPYCPGDWF
jgi:hypothetical protein